MKDAKSFKMVGNGWVGGVEDGDGVADNSRSCHCSNSSAVTTVSSHYYLLPGLL